MNMFFIQLTLDSAGRVPGQVIVRSDFFNRTGIGILAEEEHFMPQKPGEFDTKSLNWIATPADIRKLGGALYCDRRHGRVFVGHNGAESYLAAGGSVARSGSDQIKQE